MLDLTTMITSLRRPRLLVRAAKVGAQEYDRDRHLQRLFSFGDLPGSGAALMRLFELEREMNTQRCEGDAAYSLVRHLDLLIALIGEGQRYQATRISQHN
ncbi:MAG: DUF6477 family protein [Ruegeria sp.]